MTTRSLVTSIGLATLVTVGGLTADALTQEAHERQGGGFPDLVRGLMTIEGCIGVETAQTSSGKNVVFAWFEDKEAVERWYYSEIHQQLMDLLGDNGAYPDAERKPMRHIADDSGPIMVIASMTMSDKPAFAGLGLPISQIAVEIYQPLPGGLFLGKRFAPAGVKVAHIHDLTPSSAPVDSD